LKKLENKSAHNRIDYIGLKNNKLAAIRFVDSKNHRLRWLFRCACGTEKVIPAYRVKNGIIKSCGCIKSDKKPESFEKRLFHIYKQGAKRRGYAWDLGFDEFIDLTKQDCFYCEKPPTDSYSYLIEGYSRSVNGVDRIINKEGYYAGNVVACCKVCNKMKMDMSMKDFLNKCKEIAYCR